MGKELLHGGILWPLSDLVGGDGLEVEKERVKRWLTCRSSLGLEEIMGQILSGGLEVDRTLADLCNPNSRINRSMTIFRCIAYRQQTRRGMCE